MNLKHLFMENSDDQQQVVGCLKSTDDWSMAVLGRCADGEIRGVSVSKEEPIYMARRLNEFKVLVLTFIRIIITVHKSHREFPALQQILSPNNDKPQGFHDEDDFTYDNESFWFQVDGRLNDATNSYEYEYEAGDDENVFEPSLEVKNFLKQECEYTLGFIKARL